MATTPQDAQASLDAIQAALKAVGGTGTAPSPDDNTLAIEQAMQAVDKPVRVIIPDKGPADFLSGGYGSLGDAGRHAVGGAVGELNMLTSLPGMLVGGLASIPAAGLHALFPNTMPTGEQALEEGEDLFQIHPTGEYAQGAGYTQGAAGKALEALTSTGGTGAAAMADSLMGSPKNRAQAASREAVTRSVGEAIINAALLAIGGKAGEEALAEKPDVSRATSDGTPPEEPPLDSGGVKEKYPPSPAPETDFQARMQAAAPKPKAPEKVTPEVQEANVSSLEAPYRATPADPVSVFPKLPKYLQGAKPKMGEQGLTFASDLDKAAYIVANPRTSSARHADYLEWLAKALGTDENTALFLAKRSKAATVAIAKAGRGDVPAYLRPAAPGTPVHPIPAPEVTEAVPGAPASVPGSGMAAVDKALQGTRLTRTPIPPGGLDMFTQANNLRIGTGEGQPLPYTQYVRDVFPTPADEVISTIGDKVFQYGKGDPTRVHLPAEDIQALNQAMAARGWPKHRVDIMEKLSAAMDYALQNRQLRNEGYAPMRGAIQDEKLMGDMLKHPENYAVTARLDEFKSPRDFEKVCTP